MGQQKNRALRQNAARNPLMETRRGVGMRISIGIGMRSRGSGRTGIAPGSWSGVQMNAHFKLSPNPFTIDAVQPAIAHTYL